MKASPQPDNPVYRCWRAVPWEALGWGLLVVSLMAACLIAVYRASLKTRGTDIPQFHAAGRYVLEHREIDPTAFRGRAPTAFLKYYWPSVAVAFAGLAWMPLPMFAVVWSAIGCWTWIGLLRAIDRLLTPGRPAPFPRQATLAAGVLMTPLAMDHLCLGAFHILMLWFMVAGLARVSRGRPWSGGILLGLGVWVKLLPLLGVGYLILKRKWLAAGVAVAAAIVADLALTLPVFGPAKTWELHVKWWENQARGATERTLTDAGILDEDRISNQSLAAVLRRLTTHMGWRDTSFEGIQRALAERRDPFPERNAVALADWPPGQLRAVYLAISGALGLGVVFYCRRSGRLLAASRWATEIALVAIGTLWFSPVVWGYHFTAATLALAVISARRATHPRLAWTAAGLWLVTLASFGWRLARAFGAALWLTFPLGAILVWERDEGGGARDEGRGAGDGGRGTRDEAKPQAAS